MNSKRYFQIVCICFSFLLVACTYSNKDVKEDPSPATSAAVLDFGDFKLNGLHGKRYEATRSVKTDQIIIIIYDNKEEYPVDTYIYTKSKKQFIRTHQKNLDFVRVISEYAVTLNQHYEIETCELQYIVLSNSACKWMNDADPVVDQISTSNMYPTRDVTINMAGSIGSADERIMKMNETLEKKKQWKLDASDEHKLIYYSFENEIGFTLLSENLE